MNFWDHLDLSNIGSLLTYIPSEPMIFSTGIFFFLFVLFLLPYMAIKNTHLRIIYVALFSLFFYYKSGGWYVLLLLLSTTSDFIIGRKIAEEEDAGSRKNLLLLSICINLGVLAYFKYFNMLGALLFALINQLGFVVNKPSWILMEYKAWDIILPVGISFYTFQNNELYH